MEVLDEVTEVLDVLREVLAVVVVAPIELKVALPVEEELVMLDCVVPELDEVLVVRACCPGLIMTNTSAPATTTTAIMIEIAILTLERARVRGPIFTMRDSSIRSSLGTERPVAEWSSSRSTCVRQPPNDNPGCWNSSPRSCPLPNPCLLSEATVTGFAAI